MQRVAQIFVFALACWTGAVTAAATAAGDSDEASRPRTSMRLISESQYLNTVRSIFGEHIQLNVRFAPVRRMHGMTALGASQAILTPGALDSLDRAAHLVAEQVVNPEYRGFVIPCEPAVVNSRDDACAGQFFSSVGQLLYRRPLTGAERAALVNVAGSAVATAGDFYEGLEVALVGMLLSPHFLFIREQVEPAPGQPEGWRLDAYSKASRLSFMLWAAGPDAELLTAAKSGALHRDADVRQQVERMLASPRLREGVRAFFSDFLILEAFDNLTKDQTIFPAFTARALADAREQQLQLVVDHLIDRKGDYRDLFTTPRTMLTPDLAGVYGIPVGSGASKWVPFEFDPKDKRAGFLTQVGFLAQHAHPGRSSPTRRGRALREIMLCQHVPDAPPNVDFSLLEDPNANLRTARERLDIHNTDRTCRGCHAITDPIGLGLENFDGAGQFRLTEGGAVIDPAGTLDGVDFKTAVELGAAVRDNLALTTCFVQRVYTAGVGRALWQGEEEQVIDPLLDRLDARGYRWKDVLRAVSLSDAFFNVVPAKVARSPAELAAGAGG